MALYYSLPVYKQVYDLILKVFEATKDFSKEYKYTLRQDMKRDALSLVPVFVKRVVASVFQLINETRCFASRLLKLFAFFLFGFSVTVVGN